MVSNICKYLKRDRLKVFWWCWNDMPLPYAVRKSMKIKESPYPLGKNKKGCDYCEYNPVLFYK